MSKRLYFAVVLCAALLAAGCTAVGVPAEPQHWIGTWAAASQPPFAGKPDVYRDQTLRLIVHASAEGSALRVRISNIHGDLPLVIGSVHVARRAKGSAIESASDRTVTFAGKTAVTIPAHSMHVSDAVDFAVPAMGELAVSMFFPEPAAATTTHLLALQASYVAPGNAVASTELAPGKTIRSWPFLAGIDVAASPGGSTLVVFGDSHVDGDGSTANANQRWTDHLAARLQAAGLTDIGVVNEGMIGNRLLRESPPQLREKLGEAFGPAAVDRFERDALDWPNVKIVIVRTGVNDIAFPGAFSPADEVVDARSIADGFRQLVARAHARSVRVVGTTIPPFEGATLAPNYHTAAKEQLRQAVNEWIRADGAFDAVVDLDGVLRDPAHPARLLPRYDSGDHLHPNDAGYAAMAEAVPVESCVPADRRFPS